MDRNNKNDKIVLDVDDQPLYLIVDDDEICQKFIITQLQEERLFGVDFIKYKTAENVNQAVELIEQQMAKEENFDIIFLDMYLKDNQYGTDLLQIIKEKKWLQHALIIVMSGTDDSNVVEKCYEYKIQNFIKKPTPKLNFKNEMIKVRKTYLENLICPIKTYKYLDRLGEGTNGKVDLIRDKKTKIKYAMKTIKLVKDETSVSKKFEELHFTKGMNFPTVINLKEFLEDKNNLYLVLEYAELGTLNDVVKRSESKKEYIPDNLIIDWITEVLYGLFNIHDARLMHRDIKTENLLLLKNNVAKIGDFGVARALGDGGRAGTMVGTPFYIAPEIFLGQPYGMKIDIWSLGVVLFELLTNQLPFKGFDTEEVKKKVTTLDYNQELIPKNRNPELVKLLKQMLVLDPERRLSSEDALKTKLINDNLISLIDRKQIELDDESLLKLSKISYKFVEPNITDDNHKVLTNYFHHIEQALKIDSNAIKSSYKPGFFKTRINNLISGSNFEFLQKDIHLTDQQIEELIQNKFIINIINKNLEEFDTTDNSYYQVKIDENPELDNTIIYPLEQTVEDPLELSISCLKLTEIIYNQVSQLEIDDVDRAEIKSNIMSSREFLDFLIEIRKLNQIKLNKCSKDVKLAVVLNIYQTMLRHYQIKSMLHIDKSEGNSGLFDMFVSFFFNKKKRFEVVYKIGGESISLTELKHVVIRRNKKPIENYFRLSGSSDVRISWIEENNPSTLLKLLLICIDPIDNFNDYIFDFSAFDDKKIGEQIDKRCQKFFADNIKLDDNEILVPKFLLNYITDFGANETDLLKFLLKFNLDPDLKMNQIIKALTEKKIKINYC